MNKLVLAAICIIGFQSSSIAQESTTEMTSSTSTDTIRGEGKINFYASFGAAFVGDYKINDKLRASGLPQMSDVLPEFTFGYNVTVKKISMDMELNANYSDEKDNDNRVRTAGWAVKMRWHYIPVKTNSFFISGGGDISYAGINADIFSRGNVIDLNDLDPDDHTGHISLKNEQLFLGPSVAIGFFQNKSFPIRLNLGYEWGLTNGKWKSDFADVTNTVKESGQGRGYAKLTIGL